ncbi:polymorphic toxin-type HINT domain-containing protein [Streptomyces niveus]|uniref:polymorphic toxin-type HINT domain-containing protein n=1 Tax=Streptomyces niveus TaxID=193462 RepID=UPI0036A65C9F
MTKNFNVTRWSTDTAYTGDTVTTTAPEGGQATAVVTDALGRTTENRQYAGTQPTGSSFTATQFTYTPAGQQKTVTGPDNATWTYGYDLFGRQTSNSDPDKGKNTTVYDSLDQVTSTTDVGRNKTLVSEYDVLGRKTGLWDGTKTDASKLAAWTFDTLAKGKPDTSVRYENGVGTADSKTYTQKVTKYDAAYRAETNQLTLPATDPLVVAGVPGTLTYGSDYNTIDGTLQGETYPAVAGLPSEITTNTYNGYKQQLTTKGKSGYLLGATYSPVGDLRQFVLGTDSTSSAPKASLNYDYEPGTRRLTRSYVTDDVHGYMPQELKFAQDAAGNVTSIFDATTQGGTTKADYQCFTYDGHRRLTDAWTPKTADCATAGRTTANIDGAAPYWTSYTYNTAGQRKTETQHAAAGNSTTNYTYGTPAPASQPHSLTSTTGAKAGAYEYDSAGNTTSRPGAQAKQALTWNSEGDLVSATEPAAGTKPATGTSYLYDAGGELLISRNTTGDGDTVLYLGNTEVRLTTKGTTKTLTGTRYYQAAGQTIAIRTGTAGVTTTKLSFLAADHHGTSSLVLEADTYAITKRHTTPFGAPRGTTPTTWPDDKGFLGKPADTTTGLTHIGAREYDPGIGQFISVDPVLALDQHQSMNGYAYANQNPVTHSDPTGMWIDDGTGHSEPIDDGHGDHNIGADGEDKWPVPGGSGGGGGTATAPSSGSGGGGGKGGGCGFWDFGCGLNQSKNGASDLYHGTGEVFYGLIGNVPYAAENFGVLVDSDCWNGGAGAPGCDYGTQYDNWIKGQGIDTSSDAYQAPSALLAIFGGGLVGMKAGKGSRGTGKCSFSPSTEVLMEDGETKEIAEIELGDRVEAGDPKTGKHEGPRPVTATHINYDDDLIDLVVETARGRSTIIETTSNHPFWDDTTRKWVAAGKLTPGHTLKTDSNKNVRVEKVRIVPGAADMYNLTVADLHTYYVFAGNTPVLVHNTGPTPLCDLTKPGPYAVESIPARSQSQRFTQGEKDAINRIGDWFGCHSCGAPSPGRPNWTPDHQPVSRFVLPGTPQRLYPHCMACSSRQGGLVGHMPANSGVPYAPRPNGLPQE